MKRFTKKTISLLLCLMFVTGIMSISGLAVNDQDYTDLQYENYVYLGDSIAWGYGLDPSLNTKDPATVCKRIEGSYGDIVGKILEQNNDADVYAATSSGARFADWRTLLERGMGVQDPYVYDDGWFGERSAVRTNALMDKGDEICSKIRNSDLITMQLGINDITSTLVNAVCACGFIDINKLTSIEDTSDVKDYLSYAIEAIQQDPNIIGNIAEEFHSELIELRTNTYEVIKDTHEMAPEDCDILVVGYSDLVEGIRILPNTDFSPILDIIGGAIISLNDYIADVTNQFDNVYFVDMPDDISVYYDEGTALPEILENVSGLLYGLHPNAEGHEQIAECVLEKLEELNVCNHSNLQERTYIGESYLGYKSSIVCADCGEVLSYGNIVTPVGEFNIPRYFLKYSSGRVQNALNTAMELSNVSQSK